MTAAMKGSVTVVTMTLPDRRDGVVDDEACLVDRQGGRVDGRRDELGNRERDADREVDDEVDDPHQDESAEGAPEGPVDQRHERRIEAPTVDLSSTRAAAAIER